MKQSLKIFYPLILILSFCVVVTSCSKDHSSVTNINKPSVITASVDIAARVDEFRQLLGNPLNVTTGNTTGRREINWDAVPDQFINTSLPLDFFNVTNDSDPDSRKKGFAYADSGNFRVSNSGFSNVESSLSPELGPFSGDKIFANLTSVAWHTEFQVPGSAKPASVKGFGAVFIDVDIANTSFLEYFSGDSSLGKFYAPVHDAGSKLSFVGVYFDDVKITKVLIHHGTGTIAAGNKDITEGGTFDIVAMDDFLYDEPKALK